MKKGFSTGVAILVGLVLAGTMGLMLWQQYIGQNVQPEVSSPSPQVQNLPGPPPSQVQIEPAPWPAPNKLHSTMLNEDKDLRGWYSGSYIDLRWDSYNFSFFKIYKKTNAGDQWKLVNMGPHKLENTAGFLERYENRFEYFDSDLDKFKEVSYKVEAVTEKGAILKSYAPIFFQLE